VIELRGAAVIVTGASRGLGEVVAKRLAAEGCLLALVARDAAKLAAVRDACPGSVAISADITQPDDQRRLVAEAEAAFGAIDGLVNNAGVEVTVGVLDLTDAEIADTLATNLAAPIALSRLVLPGMLARKRGAVANVSSMSGKGPTPYNSAYAAAKHGLNGFTSSVAIELAGTGVHMGVVCPGFVGGAGMWASTGLKAPWVMREVTPEAVAEAVVRVLRGSSEELVTAGPIRPLLAIQELFPSLKAPLMARFGITAALKARAESTRR
jgi:short-subunit dehydrogenase